MRVPAAAEEAIVPNGAVQMLPEGESRFSDLLRNMEVAAVMLDRNAAITFCNDYLLRLTGWRREEILGPVLSVLTYRDGDHAVEIANDTTNGLHAYILSTDVERAPPCIADPGGSRGYQWHHGTAVSVRWIQAVGHRSGL